MNEIRYHINRYYRWTNEGDSLCDAALDLLFPHQTSPTGVDLLARLQDYCEVEGREYAEDPAYALYSSLLHPPHDLCAKPEEIALASDFFLDYAAQIAQSLAFFSLAGGFARSVTRSTA